ncbi:hypothetical protein [Alkalihalophilus marmarensis]|uniref:hypothetical protein n=1 Tax=Alkalihalophilus marmarensis TaxID=521377 RepID=UPI002DBF4F2A|nr:hypothetical protein [Alkalihalophilus marmarensis]MEC2071343.1 hypothetical protein [Alkalihalophilus marmarensis]
MIDLTSTPASQAQQLHKKSLSSSDLQFTYTGCIDETALYDDINRKLIELEKSLEIDNVELETIKVLASEFKVSTEFKEEILMRIDWLERLYKAKEEIGSIDTLEKAKQLRRLISPVQTCPMKQQLMTLIAELEQSLSEAHLVPSEIQSEHRLMEESLEEAGDVFLNLGKVGRESVIADVISRFGENTSIDIITEMAEELEQRVKALSEEENHNELLVELEQLPLKSFAELTKGRKASIVKNLIKQSKWSGLAALDRQIAQLDRSLAKKEHEKNEAENTILTNEGKATTTLNINDEVNGLIKSNK